MIGTRKKVLWVDDEIEFLRSHIMFLETRGYGVVPVYSGDDAVALLREKPREFDIVLLDEQMPGKTGLVTLEEIKGFLPDLPVVMVTKSEEESLMEDALGRKIDGYLTKPVNPSQILSVCKSVLDSRKYISSQIRQRFVRGYSENRSLLSGSMAAADWIRLYTDLVYWDFELDGVDDEGLRQNHAGQKSDCDAAFCQFVAEHYGDWVRGERRGVVLSTDVMKKYVAPRVKDGRPVVFMVMDCLRLDQFTAIEALLKSYYQIERYSYFSVLPSAALFSRSSLLDGRLPSDLALAYPGIFDGWGSDDRLVTGREREMVLNNLSGLGLAGNDLHVASITDTHSASAFVRSIDTLASKKVSVVLVNSVSLLLQSRSTSVVIAEIAPDESAFRGLTHSWFHHSVLFQALRELAHLDATVILVSDHGSVLCGRGTELYGAGKPSKNIRYTFGKRITCDDRHTLFLSPPGLFGIPEIDGDTCILGRENYYFVYSDKFKNLESQYQNSFHYGGVSMEEMIVPLAVMNPL